MMPIRTLAALALVAVVLTGCAPKPAVEQAAPQPVVIKVGKPTMLEEPETVAVSGSVVSPGDPVKVAFTVGGRVIQAGPRIGDAVRQGDILGMIDPSDYKIGVQAATAQVAGARVALQRAESPVRPELLEQARIGFDRASDEFRRAKMLYDTHSIPPNDFEKVRAAYEAARQQHEQAKAGGAREDRAQARAAVDQAVAAEDLAKKRLFDATLRAPISGYVSMRNIEPGAMAAAGIPVFQLVQLNPVEVTVGVPETDVRLVRSGQSAEIRIPALPGEQFYGTVQRVAVAADASTRTFMARISVPNPKQVLRVGMVAEATIKGTQVVKVLTVPAPALIRDPQGAVSVFVYFPDQKRVYSRLVQVGSVRGAEVEVRSGLAPDNQIVTGGQDRLRDGMVVTAEVRP
ncbi:MAG: efflux RND transporter periplasmic adaptor subunit [Bryobacterales bacterium]|nr:efflux RND transporter periplasmic adaptor subunit [Bryobacterales bacterium]